MRRVSGGRHVVSTRVLPPAVSSDRLAGVIDSGAPMKTGLVGIDTATEQATSDAAGVATVTFGPPQSGTMWRLQSVIVHVSGSPGSSASVYVGPPANQNLRAGTNKGDLDSADRSPPVFVPSGQPVTVQWVSAGVGNVCTATIQYEIAPA